MNDTFWTINLGHVITFLSIATAGVGTIRGAWAVVAAITKATGRLDKVEELAEHTHACIEIMKIDVARLDERWHNFVNQYSRERARD